MCCLIGLAMVTMAAETPCFHFRFDKTLQQDTVQDLLGKTQCVSEQKLFICEHGGLRIAEGAQFYIPSEQLPELKDDFTINVWYFGGKHNLQQTIVRRGKLPDKPQIQCGVMDIYPIFDCMTENGAVVMPYTGWGAFISYTEKNAVLDAQKCQVRPGAWHMLTYTFTKGLLEIHVDGVKVISRNCRTLSALQNSQDKLFIGATLEKNIPLNKINSNMLINDLALYSQTLSESDIQALYDSRKDFYENEFKMDEYSELPACTAYIEKVIPGYDPTLAKRIPQTENYLKNIPEKQDIPDTSSSKLQWNNGSMKIAIDDKLYWPLLYSQLTNMTTDPNYGRFYEDPAAAGFKLYGGAPGSWHDFPKIWMGDGKYDFSLFDQLIRKQIELNPNARIQVALHPEPNHWFQQQHRRELELYYVAGSSTDQLKIFFTGPLGSDVWVSFVSRMLEALARHIEAQDYANHVYDYKLFMAGGGEWYWPGCFVGGVSGYSEATRDTFRQWLKGKYASDVALQKAWNDDKVTLDTAAVPSPEFRFTSEYGIFRDYVKARPVYDFREYMDDRTVMSVSEMTAGLKRGCNNRKTVTTYYGYGMHYTQTSNPTQFTSAVYTLGRVFRLNTVDHLATPIVYSIRQLGEPGVTINPFNGSARLHDKLIWHENDLRTHMYPEPVFGHPYTWQESCSQIRRGFCLASTMGMGCWFLALPTFTYHEEHIMEQMAQLQKVADAQLKDDMSSTAEIALVFDEESMRHIGNDQNDSFLRDHVFILYNELFHTGAPFDSYLVSDIAHPKMPDYKLYLFLTTYEVTPEKMAQIKAKVCKNNAVVLWCYAPGFVSENGFSTDAMKALTGISFGYDLKRTKANLTLNSTAHPLTKYAANSKYKQYSIAPFVFVDDSQAIILGTADERPALAVKEMDNWTSVYSAMPMERTLLAGLYDMAGIHRYNRSWDVFSCNKNYMMLHATTAGDKAFQLRQPSDVTEVFSGRTIGNGITEFIEKNVPFGDTRYYRIIPTNQ